MCALFGFVDNSGIISSKVKQKLLNSLSVSSECRGSDATGISYVKDGYINIFKIPRPAHRLRLHCPPNTIAVSGHTRAFTLGSPKKNYNNHPFKGTVGDTTFSLSHNGIICNIGQLREQFSLKKCQVETDSYVCVQLIEHFGKLDFESLKQMAEAIRGSFTIVLLDNRNNLFIIKGENPIELVYAEDMGLFVYTSTDDILRRALKKCRLSDLRYTKIPIKAGEFLKIAASGEIERSGFNLPTNDPWDYFSRWSFPLMSDSSLHELLELGKIVGVSDIQIQNLIDLGYDISEILELFDNPRLLNNQLDFIELGCNDDFEL